MLRTESLKIPRGDGHDVDIDLFIPTVSDEFDPNVRRTTIVVLPGGGYRFICEREAEPVALFFAAQGFNTVVVRYRVAPETYPEPLLDAGAAVAYVRHHADEMHSHPDKIAVMGFSAGGHLAALLSNKWRNADLWHSLGLKPSDVRPNASILSYAVINAWEYAHRDSFNALTGTEDLSAHTPFSAESMVSEFTPPTFAWCTWTDQLVPAANTLLYAQALYAHNVPAEVHVYPVGKHGLSLSRDYTCSVQHPEKAVPECEEWTDKAIRFLKRTFSEAKC